MDGLAATGNGDRVVTMTMQIAQTSFPSPTGILRTPPSEPIETIGASIAIILALAAAVLGYRIIRGGRGL